MLRVRPSQQYFYFDDCARLEINDWLKKYYEILFHICCQQILYSFMALNGALAQAGAVPTGLSIPDF